MLPLAKNTALAGAAYVAACVGFRISCLESFTPDETTQAIALLCLLFSLYSAPSERLQGVPEYVQVLGVIASVWWTRQVQVVGPSAFDKNTMDMRGKSVLVTGATGGIGLETARGLLSQGATVYVGCRDVEKAKQLFGPKVQVFQLNLESLEQVKEFAKAFTSKVSELDVLINNAGTMPTDRVMTVDGFESAFQTNCLSTTLLTMLLVKPLLRGSMRRVVSVSSCTNKLYQELDETNMQSQTSFSMLWNYGRSKFLLNQTMFELAKRDEVESITFNVVHPGAITTDIGRHLNIVLRTVRVLVNVLNKTAWQGAASQLFLATNESVSKVSGKYFEHCQIQHVPRLAPKDSKRFFAQVEQLVGVELKNCV
ncbi:hypothetical protein BASA81_015845 [Batrachochytrium salamandrivorans]|nr:hypothetical protein BASA81_015845 [Batrachochytrium salamandrivorans]